MGLAPAALGPIVQQRAMLPLAAEHGGFLFAQLDAVGIVRELHSLFTPEGWGREVHTAGREALEMLFGGPCCAVMTLEVQANGQSRPPRSFGFVQIGDWMESPVGSVRPWLLTKDAWTASPAFRRMH